jgi:hypothetical protein
MTAELMKTWPRRPIIYEINTWVWLNELSRRYGRPIKLGSVTTKEWDQLAELGFDGVWLMGASERSPAGREISLSTPAVQEGCRRTLPDFTPEDVSGSPYCIRRYVVDNHHTRMGTYSPRVMHVTATHNSYAETCRGSVVARSRHLNRHR